MGNFRKINLKLNDSANQGPPQWGRDPVRYSRQDFIAAATHSADQGCRFFANDGMKAISVI